MRSVLKPEAYYTHYLELEYPRITRFSEKLYNGDVPENRVLAIKQQIFMISLHILIAKYSAGYDVGELEKDFPKVIDYMLEGWDYEDDFLSLDDYISLLWMLSIGVMLEIESSDFDKIVSVIDKCQYRDFVYDTLISSRNHNHIVSTSEKFPNEFGFLKTFFENKDVAYLRKYLDKNWYKRMKPTYWYDNDKNKNDTFFGYWSFESGALVKILGLDDSSLKEQQYYPYDLVHYKDLV